jgi:hypothetical protein
MAYLIKSHGYAAGISGGAEGQYLEWYDPNKPATEELGGWTDDKAKALRFDTMADAWRTWRKRRTVKGEEFNTNGSPNRPLTAFTIEVIKDE